MKFGSQKLSVLTESKRYKSKLWCMFFFKATKIKFLLEFVFGFIHYFNFTNYLMKTNDGNVSMITSTYDVIRYILVCTYYKKYHILLSVLSL